MVAEPGHWVLRVHVQMRQRGRRNRRERVDLRAELAQRRDQLGAAVLVAEVGHFEDHHLAAAHHLGDLLEGRELHDPPDRGRLFRRRRQPLSPGFEHLRGPLPRERKHPGVEGVDRVEVELDCGDRGEAAAAAAQRPEEVGLAVAVGANAAPVGQHGVDREDAVGGQAVRPPEPGQTAAERVTDDADVDRGPGQRRQAVL